MTDSQNTLNTSKVLKYLLISELYIKQGGFILLKQQGGFILTLKALIGIALPLWEDTQSFCLF